MNMRITKNHWFVLIPIIVGLVFGSLLFIDLANVILVYSTDKWVRTNAEVVRLENRFLEGGIRRTGGIKYNCEYEYEIDKVKYACSRVSPCFLSAAENNEIIKNFKVCDRIEIWVRADDPTYATISRKVGVLPLGLFCIVFISAVFAVPFMIIQLNRVQDDLLL